MVCFKISVLHINAGTFMKFWYFTPYFWLQVTKLNVLRFKYTIFGVFFFCCFFHECADLKIRPKQWFLGQKWAHSCFSYDNFNRVLVPKSKHLHCIRVVFFWMCWKVRFFVENTCCFWWKSVLTPKYPKYMVMCKDSVNFSDLHMLFPFSQIHWSSK